MISGKKLEYQLRSTEKIQLPVLTEPSQEIQTDFFGELQKKCDRGTIYSYRNRSVYQMACNSGMQINRSQRRYKVPSKTHQPSWCPKKIK